jgi:hypothetical protein
MFLRLDVLVTLYEIIHLEAVPCFGDQLATATPNLKGAQAQPKHYRMKAILIVLI